MLESGNPSIFTSGVSARCAEGRPGGDTGGQEQPPTLLTCVCVCVSIIPLRCRSWTRRSRSRR